MSERDLVWATAVDLARRIASREVSAVEVVRAHLDHISALDGRLNAFITVCEDDALEGARAAERSVLAGETLGPLHGVPVGLKDLFDTRGVRTTGGARKILGDRIPEADAAVVGRLRAAGAIVLGKLNMHEFAYGPEGLNDHYGHTRNPWDPTVHRIAGGSSSGSGAAVAAGLCPIALGSDTGGSIRIPASLCGITGLKPTYGRTSRAGVLPLAWSMDHVGPMTRSAADAALVLSVMAGYDPADPSTSVLPVPDYAAALKGTIAGLRVGVLTVDFLEAAAPGVQDAVRAALHRLQQLGAVVDEVRLESIEHVPAASAAIVASEAFAYHASWLLRQPGDYQRDVRERLCLGAFISGPQYVRAQQFRTVVRDEVNRLLARRDVLVAPSTPLAATPVGQTRVIIGSVETDVRGALISFTRPFNLSGHPACSIPCGFSPEGLPIGLQIIGRPFDEATILRVADTYQRATDWHARRPPTTVASDAPFDTSPSVGGIPRHD
jgi:aspartyl-tRNA(Asn)/glutamyl-tRNA(Gln) amidotransferase subunit A